MSHELDFFQKGVNRLFEDLGWTAQGRALSKKGLGEITFSPACDVEETEANYLLSFDLPGVAKENVKIELNDRELVVSGERKEERNEESKTRRFVERSYGSFYRTFTLPSAVGADKIRASFDNGVLKIAISKSEATKTKQIPIEDAKKGKDMAIHVA